MIIDRQFLDSFVYNPPVTPYLSLVHVDEHLIVVNKPSGLLSVPGRVEAHQDSVWYRVTRVFPTATVVHRLDMATSGLIVLARNKAAHRHLSYQFAQRITQKRYYARVFGVPQESKGIVNVPLSVDYPNRPLQKVDWENGKPAVTCYQVRQDEEHGCLVELHPITGRSHQLRMHSKELGTPILGDRLYSPKESVAAVSRLQLHAQSIQLVHPLLGKRVTFECDVPFSNYTPQPLEQTYSDAKELLAQSDIDMSDLIE
jgi:tRNA pseudouridine32 synthase/23S rRNA pseudouridine746 synthase